MISKLLQGLGLRKKSAESNRKVKKASDDVVMFAGISNAASYTGKRDETPCETDNSSGGCETFDGGCDFGGCDCGCDG